MATRRGLLKGAVILGGAWLIMARPWTWVLRPALEVADIEGLAPFQRLEGAQRVSGGGASGAVLIGLDAPDPVDPELDARLRRDLATVVVGEWSVGDAGPVPVTYFTDIRCPICRVLEGRLAGLDGITMRTREFPVFGESSERAARAVLAASLQGQGEVLRQRLHRAPPVITRATIEGAVSGITLDEGRFFSEMEGADVTARLAEDVALARIFRLPGTPALIIGHTLVIGAPSERQLAVLVALARA